MKKNLVKKSFSPMMVRSNEQLASTIKRIRKLYGLSQVELAKKTGLTQAAISRVESQANERVEIRTLFLIFSALNIDLVITPRPQSTGKISLEGLF